MMKKHIVIIAGLLAVFYLPTMIFCQVCEHRIPGPVEVAMAWAKVYSDFYQDYPLLMLPGFAIVALSLLWLVKAPRVLSGMALLASSLFVGPVSYFTWIALAYLPDLPWRTFWRYIWY